MRSATKIRTGLTAGEIKQAFRDNLCCGLGRLEGFATKHDLYVALALTVRDRLLERHLGVRIARVGDEQRDLVALGRRWRRRQGNESKEYQDVTTHIHVRISLPMSIRAALSVTLGVLD